MNHIKNIEIKNFKSIRHQTIDDCKRINVFIGYPNVGKSNILEALSLFSIDESNLNISPFVRIENLTTLFFNGDISKQSEIRVNEKHRFVIRYQKDSTIFQQQFERDGTYFEKEDTGKIFLSDEADVSVKKSFQIFEKNKLIDSYKSSSIGKENNLPDIRRYEFLKQIQYSNKGFYNLAYPYGDNIFNIISANEALLKEITELFERYGLELIYDSRSQEFQILKRIGIKGFTVPYNLIADTLRRLIFYKAAILSNKDSVLLFEEPEAHMFPPYISKFTADVMYNKNDNQYFIATHSPFVINDFMENLDNDELAIYLVSYKKETGETIIDRMSKEEMHDAYQFGYDFFMNIENFIPQSKDA